jgi:hypothetical protein
MTPIETLAAVFAVMALVKFVVIGLNMTWWRAAADWMVARYESLIWVYFVFSAVLFYFLYQELSLAQIFVAMMFGMCLFGMFLTRYPKAMRTIAETMLANGTSMIKKAWLPILLWTLLSLWVLWELFL